MRRTDVRPISNRRGISDLLPPARYGFRISAASRPPLSCRPPRLPFRLAAPQPSDILPQGLNLPRDGVLVVGGHAGVEAGAKHFRRLPCLAKNAIRFGFLRGPFYGHFVKSVPPGRRRSFPAR